MVSWRTLECKSVRCLETCCCSGRGSLSRRVHLALCPRGGLCFLGTWLILGPPLSLQSLGVLPAWKCSKCLLPFLRVYKTACVCPSLQVSTDGLIGEWLDLSVHVCPPKARVYGIFTLLNCKYKPFLGAGGMHLCHRPSSVSSPLSYWSVLFETSSHDITLAD